LVRPWVGGGNTERGAAPILGVRRSSRKRALLSRPKRVGLFPFWEIFLPQSPVLATWHVRRVAGHQRMMTARWRAGPSVIRQEGVKWRTSDSASKLRRLDAGPTPVDNSLDNRRPLQLTQMGESLSPSRGSAIRETPSLQPLVLVRGARVQTQLRVADVRRRLLTRADRRLRRGLLDVHGRPVPTPPRRSRAGARRRPRRLLGEADWYADWYAAAACGR
jgi:hypothetical protein